MPPSTTLLPPPLFSLPRPTPPRRHFDSRTPSPLTCLPWWFRSPWKLPLRGGVPARCSAAANLLWRAAAAEHWRQWRAGGEGVEVGGGGGEAAHFRLSPSHPPVPPAALHSRRHCHVPLVSPGRWSAPPRGSIPPASGGARCGLSFVLFLCRPPSSSLHRPPPQSCASRPPRTPPTSSSLPAFALPTPRHFPLRFA